MVKNVTLNITDRPNKQMIQIKGGKYPKKELGGKNNNLFKGK